MDRYIASVMSVAQLKGCLLPDNCHYRRYEQYPFI